MIVTRLTATSEESRSHSQAPSSSATSDRPARAPSDAAGARAGAGRSRSPPLGRKRHRPKHLDLWLELHPEALLHPAAPLGHQRDHVGGAGVAVVLDEVRVLGGEARSPDAQPAASGCLEQLARAASLGARVIRVLEGGAERLDPGWLGLAGATSASPRVAASPRSARPARARSWRGPPPRWVSRFEPGSGSRAGQACGASIPSALTTSTHSSTRASSPAVGVGVHPHGTAHRAWDVDPELDPAQPLARGARRHRRQPGAATTFDPRALQLDLAQLLLEFQHQSRDAFVRHQEVRPGSHYPYLQTARRSPAAAGARARSSVPARANSSAGPPVRIVVNRASG